MKYCADIMESRLGGSYLTEMQQLRGQHKTLPEIVEFFLAKVGLQYSYRGYIDIRVGHLFFSKERNVLAFFSVLYKRMRRSLRSFTFFIKECGVLCILLRSL